MRQGYTSECIWLTPPRLLDPARAVLDGDFLDVATSPDNPTGATRFYTEAENGLESPWNYPRVFCNPAWRKADKKSGIPGIPLRWWAALAWAHREDYPAGDLIFICPASVNAHWFHRWILGADAHCFPRGRVAYDMPEGYANDSSPNFDTCVAYFGRNIDVFKAEFSGVGWIP